MNPQVQAQATYITYNPAENPNFTTEVSTCKDIAASRDRNPESEDVAMEADSTIGAKDAITEVSGSCELVSVEVYGEEEANETSIKT